MIQLKQRTRKARDVRKLSDPVNISRTKTHRFVSLARTGLIAIIFAFSLLVFTPAPAQAAPCKDDNGNASSFFDWGLCDSSGAQVYPNQVVGILMIILNWLAVGVTIAVVGGIIYGAILYTTSAGEADKAKKGMDTIRGAFIALILFFAMWALLNWLVPGGMFN
jgi:hypothetical protein